VDQWVLNIDDGLRFSQVATIEIDDVAVNLTGYTATLTINDGELVLTSGSGLTLGGAAGTVAIVITAEQTASLTNGGGRFRLDLVSAGGVALPRMRGRVSVAL
jgi:hypothetical protein